MDSFKLIMGLFLIMELIQTIGIIVIVIYKSVERIDHLIDKVYNDLDLYLDGVDK